MKERIVAFVRSKSYRLIKSIGQGGTGKTVLLRDDIIEEDFVCKKYPPFYPEHKEQFFFNFVHEIKIMHLAFLGNRKAWIHPLFFSGVTE